MEGLTIYHALLAVLIGYILEYIFVHYRKKKIFIIKDSSIDDEMYKQYIGDTECSIKYFKSLSEIKAHDLFFKPYAIIINQHLEGRYLSSELFKYCNDRKISTLMLPLDNAEHRSPITPNYNNLNMIRNYIEKIVAI